MGAGSSSTPHRRRTLDDDSLSVVNTSEEFMDNDGMNNSTNLSLSIIWLL